MLHSAYQQQHQLLWPAWDNLHLSYLNFCHGLSANPVQHSALHSELVPVQVNLAFLLSSAKLATALRLMSHAERNLKRDEEAEETLVTAMRVFGGPHVQTCLECMYADTDDTMELGQMRFVMPCCSSSEMS